MHDMSNARISLDNAIGNRKWRPIWTYRNLVSLVVTTELAGSYVYDWTTTNLRRVESEASRWNEANLT